MSIIDTTQAIIEGMGLIVDKVSTAPRFAGLVATLPNQSQVYFVWSEMGEGDYHFRVARFWDGDTPFSIAQFDDLTIALRNLQISISS
ncbi:hypothetical protein UFOVP655_2 [uncultured Caudovirales phage]|uniref:Uncharacterized protein n=1 Tax=uncultured Caudovirales phage TaxID=2100421 RepID=A0A6J5NBQ5_9CAUD|nr:hypothetical protein UFOVP655_2 [uncultured Caudovirales phage]